MSYYPALSRVKLRGAGELGTSGFGAFEGGGLLVAWLDAERPRLS